MLGLDGTKHSTTTNKKSNANVTTNYTLVIHIQCATHGFFFSFLYNFFILKKNPKKKLHQTYNRKTKNSKIFGKKMIKIVPQKKTISVQP
jgi:hypothetical protein